MIRKVLAATGTVLSVFAVAIVSAGAADVFSGTWVDKSNTRNKMTVKRVDGLLRIEGGERYGEGDVFTYEVACAPEMDQKPYFNCVGWGGKLNGRDFIYSSRLSKQPDGTLKEEWFAENGDRVAGKTTWVKGE